MKLGDAHFHGENVESNPQKGVVFYKEACKGDLIPACSLLVQLYLDGQPSIDSESAYRSASKSCNQNVLLDCVRKADLMVELGVAKNKPEVLLKSYQRACNGREWTGCRKLGEIYFNGEFVTQNLPHSSLFFQRGCEGEDTISCNELEKVKQIIFEQSL